MLIGLSLLCIFFFLYANATIIVLLLYLIHTRLLLEFCSRAFLRKSNLTQSFSVISRE